LAQLQATSVNGTISASTGVWPAGEDFTPWYRLYHCADAENSTECGSLRYSCGWLHIRTPLPATAAAGLGWSPMMVEVKGFHTYSGETTHDFKAIVNSTGDGNDSWYGSQVRVNIGSASTPFVYRSNGTYGGFRRTCIAVPKIGCCCVGWIWVRWGPNSGFRADFPWATVGVSNNRVYY
jgi:hypothetical protein